MAGLTPKQIEVVELVLDQVFERLKTRALGPAFGARTIAFQFKAESSLPGLFVAANHAQAGGEPNANLMHSLLSVAERHLEAQKGTTKAQVIRAVDAFLRDHPKADLKTVLGGEVAQIFKETLTSTRRVLDTEASNVRNTGSLDGIIRVSSAMGIEDPVVYFVVVRDKLRCSECTRLHLVGDGTTPRLWRMSEIGSGYHRRGQDNPKLGGLHPHCRCTLVTLMPGYGFDGHGRVKFVGKDHDALAEQRA